MTVETTAEPGIVTEIVHTARVLSTDVERRLGVTQARLQLLAEFDRSGAQQLSQAELQRSLGIDGAAVTRQVRQLEAEGLVTRKPDPANRRTTLVRLTAKGKRKAGTLQNGRAGYEPGLLDGLSSRDVTVLRRCLRRMRENVGAPRA